MSATQKRRLEKLLDLCKTTGVDGVMILPGPNMTYLLDFTLEVFERPSFLLAVAGQTPLLVVPELDRERAEEAVGGL
ncbi:MAG: aminopeptidase P family N-terminal domain-containing protein [Candidatus Caldarchaeum sp.]|nr:aminopeptidase P family N-terminal domain-containing protein [Candidatus Caldarchaeum sp.]MDW8436229.1 aminopeptidase P family N-terminal domain-containing protein [Candidatus Caldarchaeum sp.]